MRVAATTMLAAAAALFVVCRLSADALDHPTWLGYVEAGAEAAMIGGLADWFAVVALFRHPLGLPIPHTAIVRRRKDEIGHSLGQFVQENFLAADQLVDRVRGADPSRRLATWVVDGNADRVAEGVVRSVSSVLAAIDDADVQRVIHDLVAEQVRAVPAAPLVSRALELTLADGRRDQLLDGALAGLSQVLDANRATLRRQFGSESPWWVPEGVDERVFTKLYDGIRSLLADMRADADHELRRQVARQVDAVVARLRDDPSMAARVDVWRDQLLASPELRGATASAWSSLRAAVATAADAEPGAPGLRTTLAGIVSAAGFRLAADAELRGRVDGALASGVRTLASAGGREIASLISTTVQRWDADDTSRRLELQIGRDLQFVRINGTLVGFLAGVGLHALGKLL